MFGLLRLCLSLAAGLAFGASSPAVAAGEHKPKLAAVLACKPGAPCEAKLPIRIVVVTMFEIGNDSGDVPGEFQFWKERRGLDVRIPFPQSHHDLYYNSKTGVLGIVTGMGNVKSATALMALGLDQRFDLGKAYWIVAGIAGIDPEDASIGSVAWARYLIDGDLAHEIDAREIPANWPDGYFAMNQKGPNDPTVPEPQGERFELNAALRDWAFALTKDMTLLDDPRMAAERTKYQGYPNARRPPFVLTGDQLAASTFWHGTRLNDWANRWTRYWTKGQGEFVTSAMEEAGSYQAITYLDRVDRVDKDRFLVLRAGSNYTMPPTGVSADAYLLTENDGYAGMKPALENLYTVAGKVIDTLLADWQRHRDRPPG